MASQLTASKRKIRTAYGDRVVYVGVRGGEYVKINGKFVSVSKLPKKTSSEKTRSKRGGSVVDCPKELNMSCAKCYMDKDEDVETYRCASAELEEINDWNTKSKDFAQQKVGPTVWDPSRRKFVPRR